MKLHCRLELARESVPFLTPSRQARKPKYHGTVADSFYISSILSPPLSHFSFPQRILHYFNESKASSATSDNDLPSAFALACSRFLVSGRNRSVTGTRSLFLRPAPGLAPPFVKRLKSNFSRSGSESPLIDSTPTW
jgi:hypothetical protein